MGDKEVLKYKDVVLRSSDIDTLRDSCFLNDQIITFYLTYLFSSSGADDIHFVGPSISACLANCEDDKFIEEFARSCNLSNKRLVLFVINDNDDFGGEDSGSHWSTLVYYRLKNAFQHYDSMEGVNSFHAMKLYDAVKEYMGPGGEISRPLTSLKKQRNKKKDMQSASKSLGGLKPDSVAASATAPAAVPVFTECKTPQQSNGYDCGLYVLAIARAIIQWCSGEHNKNDVISVIQKHVDYSVEVNMRSELLEIIHELQEV